MGVYGVIRSDRTNDGRRAVDNHEIGLAHYIPIPTSTQQSNVDDTAARLLQLRHDLPFLLDTVSINTEPSTGIPAPGGGKQRFSYFYFSGAVNPAGQLQGNRKKFRTSLSTTANAFVHSNWNDALLPSGLRELLVSEQIPVSWRGGAGEFRHNVERGVALSTVCDGSTGDADARAQAVAAQNLIAGLPAQSVVTACSSTLPGYNPQIQVTVTRTGIPTFLAGMFGQSTRSVSATALAEAYNPQTGYPPIAIHGVKPWAFYAPTTTTVGAALPLTPTSGSSLPMANGFYALDGPAPIACPSSNAISCTSIGTGGVGNYLDNIGCENGATLGNGRTIGPGQTFQVDPRPSTAFAPETITGIECLIHASGPGPMNTGQDLFVCKTITGGSNNPNAALQGVSNISRSDSVVTVPVINLPAIPGGPFPIAGFLQLGIQHVLPLTDPANPGGIQTVILNWGSLEPGEHRDTNHRRGHVASSGVADSLVIQVPCV